MYIMAFADLFDTIDMIKPDVILLEMHDDCYQKYGAVDGPLEMVLTCGYGEGRKIPVYGIDYWELDDSIYEKIDTTDNNRDNEMFYNIYDKVAEAPGGTTFFVLYGGAHFYNAIPRMEMSGWKKIDINTSDFYKHVERQAYQYPDELMDVLQNTINYFENQYVEKAYKSITDETVREKWLENLAESADYYRQVMEYLKSNPVY